MKKQKDILIVARPDHSLQIYDSLCKQSELSFDFVCFKVVPKWIKHLFHSKKLVAVGQNSHISIWTTFINTCIYRWHLRIAKNWTEDNIMTNKVRRLLKKNDYKIIHHWPTYDYKVIDCYRSTNSRVVTLADIHMPCAAVVFSEMKEVYESHGLDISKSQLNSFSKQINNIILKEPTLIVPSSYVADTFKKLYPNKTYVIVPYGIHNTQFFIRRNRRTIRSFVYAGTISLEKGCDLLLDCFQNMSGFVLHVYGKIMPGQEKVFKKYVNSNNIVLHGHMPREEMLSQMKDYDCGIHISRFDAYSLAVGEMIGCGLPVIVSDKTGNKDDVSKYGLGMVVGLSVEEVENAVKAVSTLQTYNSIVDNIDAFIRNYHMAYGTRMINKYKEIINGTGSI